MSCCVVLTSYTQVVFFTLSACLLNTYKTAITVSIKLVEYMSICMKGDLNRHISEEEYNNHKHVEHQKLTHIFHDKVMCAVCIYSRVHCFVLCVVLTVRL